LSTHSSNPASDAESEPLSAELALKILVAAIRASPDRCLSAGALGQHYLKHPSLRDTLHNSGGLKLFCESHTELSWSNEGLKEWGESRFAPKEEKKEAKSAQKLKVEHVKPLQQRQALAEQRLEKQDEEALQQRQVWAQQMQRKKAEDEADRQYRQELQLQIKLHEEQQGHQEKAVQQQKQALVQQKQMQQLKEEDQARRQRAWAVKFMEQHETRKEQEYYEARRKQKLEEERCELLKREQRARMLHQQQRYMYAEQVRQNEEGLLVQCTPSSFVGALSFIFTAGLQVAAHGFRALFSSPDP
jgi:outer membrane receptor for ferric coprogen and ferric-rhodotorulic acid